MRILVRRIGALGDVILTTPIIRRLREENPGADIGVQTAYPDVFKNSPHRLVMAHPVNPPYAWTLEGGVDRLFDLDLAYEVKPHKHIVQAYMMSVFGDNGEPEQLQQEIFFRPTLKFNSAKRVIALHAAKAGWRNRTLPERTWLSVIEKLRGLGGYEVVLVGTGKDALPKSKCAVYLTGDIAAQTAFISRCAAFIGSDSALIHAAGATDVPIVGVFTSALADTRLPWRKGIPQHRCVPVLPRDMPCFGCLTRRPAPVTTEFCERGDTACVDAVWAEDIVDALQFLIG